MGKKIIIQIDNMYLKDLTFFWMYYNQPNELYLVKPKTRGQTGVMMEIKNQDSEAFVEKLIKETGCKIHDYGNKTK